MLMSPWLFFRQLFLSTLRTNSKLPSFVDVDGRPQRGSSLTLTGPLRKRLCHLTPAFSLFPPYHMPIKGFVMPLKEICTAEHKIQCSQQQSVGTNRQRPT
jgi:hypothetical protein